MWNMKAGLVCVCTTLYLVSDVKAKQYSICYRKGNNIEGGLLRLTSETEKH